MDALGAHRIVTGHRSSSGHRLHRRIGAASVRDLAAELANATDPAVKRALSPSPRPTHRRGSGQLSIEAGSGALGTLQGKVVIDVCCFRIWRPSALWRFMMIAEGGRSPPIRGRQAVLRFVSRGVRHKYRNSTYVVFEGGYRRNSEIISGSDDILGACRKSNPRE